MPGVLLVLHHGNMEKVYRLFRGQEMAEPARHARRLKTTSIYYWGQYVAVVVAETLEQARMLQPPSALNTTLERRDVRTDLSADFDGKRESSWKRGDPDQALTSAPVVIDETYSTPVETHNPMEMHGTVAVWDGDNVTLYESSQGVVNHRMVMAEVLGVPRENVRVISRFIGSGFGGKLFPWPQSTMAAAAAHRAGPPGEAQRRSAHDVFQRRPPAADAAAHPAGRNTGWQADRDPSRLLHANLGARRLCRALRRADAVSL